MAHDDKCIGTWKHSTLGGKPDGNIRIDHHSGNQITGLHFNSQQSIKGTCTGTVQNFSREDAQGKKVRYKNGAITLAGDKYLIKGKFDSEQPLVSKTSKARAKTKANLLSDDWEADKTT
jgi:hypothetical protein